MFLQASLRLVCTVALLMASMGGGAAVARGAEKKAAPVLVFAAASMKNALDAVAEAWKAQTGKEVSIAYGSSGSLARQIEYGAPADLFVSADQEWMDYLQKRKLIQDATRRNLLQNELVLIEPVDQKVDLKIAPGFDLAGATGNSKVAVCTIAACPGGIYAKQSLEALGVFKQVEPKLAQADNIRNALMLVSRGEAKFGIVYATDAKADSKVRVVGVFPEASHSPIIYPVALTSAAKNPDASAFLEILSSPTARKILTEQGFTVLPK
ncbi:molybdate ABC transporter substrate-binding protein [Methylocystis sp. IM3]|uniref:molybdate ABC transporter substrate-binding protein n=1 Tax=unclassified Methylocystis TaxID=2625913 RepID=UPI0030F5B6D0